MCYRSPQKKYIDESEKKIESTIEAISVLADILYDDVILRSLPVLCCNILSNYSCIIFLELLKEPI